jgi:hypothetical protein
VGKGVSAGAFEGSQVGMLEGPEDASGMPRPGRGKRYAHLNVEGKRRKGQDTDGALRTERSG